MRSPLSLTSSSSWLLLVILSTICILSTSFIPLADAQTPSSIRPTSTTPATSTTSTTPQPTAPSPPTLPPGTRELQDSQVVADRVAQGQLQTYHFSIAQQQRLPVRRQLERIIFHPGLDKRQAPLTPTPTPPSTTTTPAAPTRTIAPTVPSPFANGTYAVFISISTCSTPQGGSEGTCPPLVLYVSTSASQPLPGPGQESQGVQMVAGQDGLIQFTAYTTRDLFFSLQPPSLQGYTGDWAVEVGASSQGYVQQYQGSPGLLLDDTDSTSASFLTYNFTAVPTFKVYLVNANTLPQGLTRSLCAIEVVQPVPLSKTTMTVTQTNRTSNLDGSMGTEIIPAEPTFEQFGQRRQVLIQSLTPGTRYTAFFITDVLNQAGAEVMFAMTPFVTKRHDNCVLITDLTFCHEVAYAVPITPMSTLPGDGGAGLSNSTVHQDIKAFYDNFTSNLMDNFNRVIGQYDCTRSQYSLIRNCTDCTRAYRRWLCSASIPRCTDVEDVIDPNNIGYTPPPPPADPSQNVNPYLIDRTKGPVVVERDTASSRGAIAQLSQNPLMNPGQYGEVLPCIDLCFDVVQSCPNFLGFNCPIKNMAGNYAHMNPTGFQCNGLGVVPVPSSGTRLGRSWLGLVATLLVVVAIC
ncbi:stretch-activated cation channel mid1 [Podila verticillata]|nr:stretch-activated cation channel mid1 [Podila verticillata]